MGERWRSTCHHLIRPCLPSTAAIVGARAAACSQSTAITRDVPGSDRVLLLLLIVPHPEASHCIKRLAESPPCPPAILVSTGKESKVIRTVSGHGPTRKGGSRLSTGTSDGMERWSHQTVSLSREIHGLNGRVDRRAAMVV